MNKRTERLIKQIYEKVFRKVFNGKNINELSKGSKISLQNDLLVLQSSSQYDKFAKKFAAELTKAGLSSERGVWRKYYEAAKKQNIVSIPKNYLDYETQVMKKVVVHNFEMIKSIPQDIMQLMSYKYSETLVKEVAEGKISRGSFEKQLRENGAKNAKLIARTETAKLQATLNEESAKELGSVAYIWKASHDMRTRQSHKDMDGVIVFWRDYSEKPLLDNMRGNAGEFPNCRCNSQAIVSERYLTQSNYKLYDYLNDKVIKVSRKELLEYLEKGHM